MTNGYDLSVGTGGLTIYGVLNAGDSGSNITQITLSGSWIASGTGDFLSGHSSVLFDGTAGSYQITSSGAFYDLVLNGTGATWTGNGTVDINGDLALSAGTFNAPSTLTLSGSLTHGANATFSHNSGVFQLDGDTQTLSGTTAFYTLKKIAGVTSTLTFSARENFTVSGTLVLRGKDNNNRLSIRSSVSGVQSYLSLDTSGSESAIFLDVQDSNAGSGQTLTCLSCTDSGNNVNWVFTTPTVTGTLYSDEGATALPGKTIAFAAKATGATDAGGQYSFTGVTLTGGTIILLYVDGAAEDAVTVVLGSGGNMTGIDLYQNRLIVRSESGTSAVTNAQIAIADNNGGAAADTDVTTILSSASSAAMTVAEGKELLIWASSTFAPGGTVDAENIDINGTLQQGTEGISVGGSWDATGGSFTSNGVVTFDTAMGSGQIILSNGSTFSGVTFSGTGTWFPRGAMDVNGNFTVSNGTFNQSGSTLNIAGNMRVASGAVFVQSVNGSLLTLDGDLYVEDETSVNMGTVQAGSSPDVITLSGSLRVHKLTVGTGDTLVLSGHNLYVGTGGLFLHGTIDASDRTNSGGAITSSTITVSGSWIAGGTGDFIAGHSSVLFNAGGGSFTISSSGSFYDLVIAGTGATYTATGALDINGDLTLSAGTFTSTPGTITLSGSWMKGENATFNHSSGSVVLNGIDQTISGSTVFHNLTKSGSTAATLTFAASANTSVSGALLLRGTLTNNLSIRSGITGLVSFLSLDTGGSETLQYLNVKDNDASGGQPLSCTNCTDAGNNTNWLFVSPNITGTLYSDEGVTPLVARTIALSVNGGTISDTAETDAGGQFVLSGATMTGGTVLTLFVNNETEDAVTVVLSSGSTMTGLHLYQNRVIVRSESGSSPVTLTTLDIANTLTDNDIINLLPVSGSATYLHMLDNVELLVWTGSTFRPGSAITVHDIDINGTLAHTTRTVYVKGSWDSGSGSVTGTGTINFAAVGSTETIRSGTFTYSGATFSGSGSWTLQDAMDVDGSFVFQRGTLNQSVYALNLSGNSRIASGAVFVKSTTATALTFDGTLTYEDEHGSNLGRVTVGNSPDTTTTLSGSLTADALTVGTGDTLVLSGHNLFIGTGGLFLHGTLDATNNGPNASTIVISGSWLASGTGDFIAGSSAVRFDASSSSYTIAASGAFFNLIVNGTGATYTASGSLDVNGNFELSAGTFTAPSTTLTVSGSWLKSASGSTFAHNSGSVVLDGGDQTVSGSTLFYNLTKTGATAQQLTFVSTTMQSVSGALTLRGGSSSARLSLRTTTDGISSWLRLDSVSGTQDLAYLDVRDNNATGGEKLICFTGCKNSGNNRNWAFHSITGTLYSDEGSTPLIGRTVAYATNGGAVIDTAETGSGGQFTLSGASLTGGTIITFFVQDAAEDAVTVVLGSGGAMTGIDLYQDRLIVRSESGSAPITNTHLITGHRLNGSLDTDITNILSGSLLSGTTIQPGKELYIWSGT
ncbi:MAG: hypothetical protein UY87_C0093G0001, partial [Candidatus Peribacteria bacterium GW2011_GWC2_54_8]